MENNNFYKTIKSTVYLLVFVVIMGCDSENAIDCFQKTGSIISSEISLESFSKITVFDGISLEISQGDTQKVTIETGENLLNDIDFSVEDGRLSITNNNGCNLLRSYGTTKVFITAPAISEIRSSTGLPIVSKGILKYGSLSLLSESFGVPEADTTSGSFILEIENTQVSIVSNGVAYFELKGTTSKLNINIASGDSRVDAHLLEADEVSVNHRGSNDLLVNPKNKISGTISSTGDVLSYGNPNTIEVQELFKGKLILK